MSKEWILDVLADLKCFARSNDMQRLAEHIEDTELVALAELATISPDKGEKPQHGTTVREFPGTAGNC